MTTGKEAQLTYQEASRRLSYDPTSGLFCWKTADGGVPIGGSAGYVNSNGYMVVGLLGHKYRLHRLAWLLVRGKWPEGTIDHINCIRTDNRWSNLRDVDFGVNAQNKVVPTKANQLGVLGVYWSDKRKGYMAAIKLHGRGMRRGPYKTTDRAYAAYVDMKRKYHEGCTL